MIGAFKDWLKNKRQSVAAKNKDYYPVILEQLRPLVGVHTRVLEVGCWDGVAISQYQKLLPLENIYGIDCFPETVSLCQSRGINARYCDIEKDPLPFEDGAFEVVIANQVFEHLKNIFGAISEIYRVLKPDGHLIIGVPNLASLHNRMLIALGRQPTCMQMFDDHVRGFTPQAFINFLTFHDLFRVIRFIGLGFYPFVPPVSTLLSRIFPRATVIMILLLKKNPNPDKQSLWIDAARSMIKQTNF
jgi:SAM-dependent methyltransferase